MGTDAIQKYGAIQKLNYLSNPFLKKVTGENNKNFWENPTLSATKPIGEAGSIKPFGTLAPISGGGLAQRIASQNGELEPKYLSYATSGSGYLNGRGEYKFGLMRPCLG